MFVDFKHTIYRYSPEDIETVITVEIESTYHPGSPDVYTLPNGDPGYPGEPEHIEIVSISPEIELTEDEMLDLYDIVKQKALEKIADNIIDHELSKIDCYEYYREDY